MMNQHLPPAHNVQPIYSGLGVRHWCSECAMFVDDETNPPGPDAQAQPKEPHMPRDRKAEMSQTPENEDADDGKGKKKSAVANPVYQAASGVEKSFLERIVKKYHKGFTDAKVNVDLQFWEGADGAPMVKKAGIEQFGKVRVFPPDMRAAGSPDIRVIIDRLKWDNATPSEQEAALDALLESKEVVTSEEGEVLRDKAGRPKIKSRKPDLIVSGFKRVAEEHGGASQEAKQFATVSTAFQQMKLFDEVEKLKKIGD